MDYTQLSDQELLATIEQSHMEALSELYNRYSGLIFTVALNIIQIQASAEEVTIDVFNQVWRKADTYRPDRGGVRTWLVSMTRYRAIDRLRYEKVRLDNHSTPWANISSELTTAYDNNPEKITDLSIARQRVRNAVAQLPPTQRQALAMAYFQGYSQREIAEMLNQPLGTIKTRIRLAMQKLRRLLQPEEVDVE